MSGKKMTLNITVSVDVTFEDFCEMMCSHQSAKEALKRWNALLETHYEEFEYNADESDVEESLIVQALEKAEEEVEEEEPLIADVPALD